MYELMKADYHKVRPLFCGINHNIPVVYSVIEKNSPGKIFVDNHEEPKSALLYPTGSYFYVTGDETNLDFNQSLSRLIFSEILPSRKEAEMVLFSFTESWRSKLDVILEDKGAIRITRKVFTFSEERFKRAIPGPVKTPDGYFLKPIDEKIAEKINVNDSWNSIADFIDKGIGICLLKGDDMISVCYSIYLGGEEAEIDIFTKEEYRDQGFGWLTAAAFISRCVELGIKPNWACWPYRKASYSLALKLGFTGPEDVPAHFWSASM
ncbi:MAG: GNAT family N-acetyltransferase [Halanaerobium sp.]|nr:GNAT family N-acetyltransferase [Halanaerobium sp.]